MMTGPPQECELPMNASMKTVSNLMRCFLLVLISVAVAAQTSVSPETSKRIEQQLRIAFQLPEFLKIDIGARAPSTEFPNFDTLVVTLSGAGRTEKREFLISRDNKTLISMTRMDLSGDSYAQTMSKIDLTNRPSRGSGDAKVTVVNYDDFQCPFCSRMHQTLFPSMLQQFGDRVRFVYKDFPLIEIHPWAMHAAVDANCLSAQSNDAYWEFADYLHANQRQIRGEHRTLAEQMAEIDRTTYRIGDTYNLNRQTLERCIKAQDETAVKAEMAEGERLGVNAAPTLFINGNRVEGAIPEEEMRAALERALAEAGARAPAGSGPQGATSPQNKRK